MTKLISDEEVRKAVWEFLADYDIELLVEHERVDSEVSSIPNHITFTIPLEILALKKKGVK